MTMKVTSNGITQIGCALEWAEFATGKSWKLSDVEINEMNLGGARRCYTITLAIDADADHDITAEGPSFDEAANRFYDACKAAEAARKAVR
jgi:hypothetical protein